MRTLLRSPVVGLLRVLVPSWRFFDAVSAPPLLLARVTEADGRFGEWRAVLLPPRRAWWNVVWHPQGNLSFACHSLLYRLRDDLAWADDGEPHSSLVSYRLVLDLVRWSLRGAHAEGPALVQYQLVEPTHPHAPLMVSEEHER